MSGPSHAEEVSVGLPTTNVVAADDRELAHEIQDIFMDQVFRVYTGTDMAGVELGGALKKRDCALRRDIRWIGLRR